jgi:hypothetical protein
MSGTTNVGFVTICQIHRPAQQVPFPFDDGTGMYTGMGTGKSRVRDVTRRVYRL